MKPGHYLGMDYMGKMAVTPEDTTDRWYHENKLTIRGDSLTLTSVPVVFYEGRPKAYSASDGGFYEFRGKIMRQDKQLIAKLQLTSQDYVLTPYKVIEAKAKLAKGNLSFEEKIKRGIVVVDSAFYKREYRITPTAKGFEMDSVEYSLSR